MKFKGLILVIGIYFTQASSAEPEYLGVHYPEHVGCCVMQDEENFRMCYYESEIPHRRECAEHFDYVEGIINCPEPGVAPVYTMCP